MRRRAVRSVVGVVAFTAACSPAPPSDAGRDAVADVGASDRTIDMAADVTDAAPSTDAGRDAPLAFDIVVPDASNCFADHGHPPAATLDTDPGPWVERATLVHAGGIIVERVKYGSGALRVMGLVCRPDDAASHPVVISNHGGFQGLTTEWTATDSFCRGGATNGYVVMESSYRGEDESDGNVEVCQGEVDDVVAMLAIIRAQPYAQPTRVAAIGGSHGGCITARLALRDPTLRAAVDFYGPSDFVPLRQWWLDEIARDEPDFGCRSAPPACIYLHECLLSTVETGAGGTPTDVPAEYAARSWVNDLANLHVPMAVYQGTNDLLVSLEQSCEVRAALTAVGHPPRAWYFDTAMNIQNPSTVCGGNFRTDPVPNADLPSDWLAADQYFFVFEGQSHGFNGAALDFVTRSSLSFILSRL